MEPKFSQKVKEIITLAREEALRLVEEPGRLETLRRAAVPEVPENALVRHDAPQRAERYGASRL